jgi:hypothetical protein
MEKLKDFFDDLENSDFTPEEIEVIKKGRRRILYLDILKMTGVVIIAPIAIAALIKYGVWFYNLL